MLPGRSTRPTCRRHWAHGQEASPPAIEPGGRRRDGQVPNSRAATFGRASALPYGPGCLPGSGQPAGRKSLVWQWPTLVFPRSVQYHRQAHGMATAEARGSPWPVLLGVVIPLWYDVARVLHSPVLDIPLVPQRQRPASSVTERAYAMTVSDKTPLRRPAIPQSWLATESRVWLGNRLASRSEPSIQCHDRPRLGPAVTRHQGDQARA